MRRKDDRASVRRHLHAARCAALVGALVAGRALAQVAEPDAFVPGDEPDFFLLAEPADGDRVRGESEPILRR